MHDDLFVLFPDLPWPRHSRRSFADQIADRRRRIAHMRREVRRSIGRQRLAVSRVAARVRERAPAARANK